jgi:major membrane immunogen (membrane-anchored lipoprotein)
MSSYPAITGASKLMAASVAEERKRINETATLSRASDAARAHEMRQKEASLFRSKVLKSHTAGSDALTLTANLAVELRKKVDIKELGLATIHGACIDLQRASYTLGQSIGQNVKQPLDVLTPATAGSSDYGNSIVEVIHIAKRIMADAAVLFASISRSQQVAQEMTGVLTEALSNSFITPADLAESSAAESSEEFRKMLTGLLDDARAEAATALST